MNNIDTCLYLEQVIIITAPDAVILKLYIMILRPGREGIVIISYT